eukprot:TRINITY_DN10716_c0_g1_i1.p1 TRINITY_DN10716_c0_g1~~TRINITY_DN10716_c0_g1_i1.p1  ORF type:complete len:369 (+),score=89.55 TRINITY_DN10716_c0_g1_i1:50-1156(+)
MLKGLEFFSGIGGLEAAAINNGITIINAWDLNTSANEVHKLNFPQTNVSSKGIEGLTSKHFQKLKSDIWLASPPCQPVTRLGKKLDHEDNRSIGVLHLFNLLDGLEDKPKYILLENVVGFESSTTRKMIINIITNIGYQYQEFHLSPTQFKIPNQRTRYFLLAKLNEEFLNPEYNQQLINFIPTIPSSHPDRVEICDNISIYLEKLDDLDNDETEEVVNDEQEETDNPFEIYYLSDKMLSKFYNILDITSSNNNHSCCFTKSYGRYFEGTGSVLQENEFLKIDKSHFNNNNQNNNNDQQENNNTPIDIEQLRNLNIRFFTPKEIANLHHFPKEFKFPDNYSKKQCYKLLGNSLCVKVVDSLLSYLLSS